MTIARSNASPQAMWDKYIQALGGAQRLAALTSFTATGTYEGFETGAGPVDLEVYAKAPAQRTFVLHMPEENAVRTYDGTNGWMMGPEKPVPLMTLTGGDLFSARVDALSYFPAGLQKEFNTWKSGEATIDGMAVNIAQGTKTGQQFPVTFYFDKSTGLLKRMMHWNETPVGPVPTKVDFDDYRVVAGVKIPYKQVITWTDGRSTIIFKQVQANAAIDPAKFARPAPGKQRK
jgi:outer membrane lipoprotein-sorting protein